MKRFLTMPAVGGALVAAAFSAGEISKTPAKLTFTEHIAPIVLTTVRRAIVRAKPLRSRSCPTRM